MYVVNGIAYAGEPKSLLSVKTVHPLDEHKLLLRFSTGEQRVFDFTPLLELPVFKPLKDKAIFDKVYVDYDTALWLDGQIDIAPETLYNEGKPV